MLDFKGRRRDVWGRFYTELFFLDEPTALAAGHRPCFECRRKDAEAFAGMWRTARGLGVRPSADQMDEVLHHERLKGCAKRLHRGAIGALPDGAFAALDGEPFCIRGKELLHWTPQGYDTRTKRPSGRIVDVLTPPTILAARSRPTGPWRPSPCPAGG